MLSDALALGTAWWAQVRNRVRAWSLGTSHPISCVVVCPDACRDESYISYTSVRPPDAHPLEQILSKRGASDKATFGWGRAEVICALGNCAFLLGITLEIIISTIDRLLEFGKVRTACGRLVGWGGFM